MSHSLYFSPSLLPPHQDGVVIFSPQDVLLPPPQHKVSLLPPQDCLPLLSPQDVLDGVWGEPGREKGHQHHDGVQLKLPLPDAIVSLPKKSLAARHYQKSHFSLLYIAAPSLAGLIQRILSFDQFCFFEGTSSTSFDHSSLLALIHSNTEQPLPFKPPSTSQTEKF